MNIVKPECAPLRAAEPARKPMQGLGARVVVATLLSEGVDTVWGFAGSPVTAIDAALRDESTIEAILARHEQGALHAADGYARATGKVGVALVNSDAGLPSSITGIATAYFDSIPLVVLVCNVATEAKAYSALQEHDVLGITQSIVKHSYAVREASQLADTLRKAFHIARTGRPGPVVVDIPIDMLLSDCVCPMPAAAVSIRSYRPSVQGNSNQIRNAARVIAQAERPYIYAGGGVISGTSNEELLELADILDAPVTTTLMGLGAFPGGDRRFLGMLGMHGTFEANMAMQECDVLIAVGARFDDRVIGNTDDFAATRRTIVHIDVDPASIGKRVKVDFPIVGDTKVVLQSLLAQLRSIDVNRVTRDAWWRQVEAWRSRKCLAYEASDTVIKPQFVIEQLWQATHGEAFVCSDVGQHQMWAAQLYPFAKPRHWINSGGLGTMGVGLPYAIGVKRAFPDDDVVAITGDGSIQMCIQELATCKQYGLPVKIVCLNNGNLGMVKQLRLVHHGDRQPASYADALPSFVEVARAYGHIGLQARTPSEVAPVIHEALALKDRTVFMDFSVDPSECVWPMVAAGSGLTDMLLGSNPTGPSKQ